jgi:molecular chaperone GrpE
MQHQETREEPSCAAENPPLDETLVSSPDPVALPDEPRGQAVEEAASSESDWQEKLLVAEARVEEMREAFLRARIEVENVRRRAQEETMRAHKFAIEEFAEALVPVKDSLETALKLETHSIDSFKEGIETTLKQLQSAFAKNRLTEINPRPGDPLDPKMHHAISMLPAAQHANTIISVLQKGYMIADRLLRPALVTVAQGRDDVAGT